MKIDKNIELHGNYLRLTFMYKKVKCNECLYLENDKKGIKRAKEIRDDVLSDIRRGTFKYDAYFPNSNKVKVFNAKPKSYLLMHLLLEQKEKILNNNNFAVSTKKDYARFIDNLLIPTFGKYEVTNFNKKLLILWVEQTDLTAKAIRTAITPLRNTLIDAMHTGIIDLNPFEQIDMRRLLSTKRKETSYEIKPFNEDEKNRILDSTSGEFRNLIQFGFYSGLRTGEMLALKWENVDLENKKIHVKHTMLDGELQPTKTKESTRTIYLLEKALEALEDQKKHITEDGFVFHNPNTREYWPKTDSVRKQWISLLKDADITYRNFYQTRHTFASMLITNNENIHKIAKYLGHKDTTMVTKIYGKYIEEGETHGFKQNY